LHQLVAIGGKRGIAVAAFVKIGQLVGQHADGNASLHVEHTGAMEPAVQLRQRHALELADGPYGVEVAE